jgi:Na+/glutamate symporter
MSEKKILRAERGVTLTEVTLHGGFGAAIATRYVVQSKRTPEAPSFSDLITAEAAFDAELKRVTSDPA